MEQYQEGNLVNMGDGRWIMFPPGVTVANTDKELLAEMLQAQRMTNALLEIQAELLIQLVNQQSDATDLAIKLHRITGGQGQQGAIGG